MSRDEAIKTLLEESDNSDLREEVRELKNMVAILLEAIVVPQKDAAEIAGITPHTIRNKVKNGELDILQGDGSRLNYLTLTQTIGLKKRKTSKRKL